MPFPGEEEANDAQLRARIDAAGGFTEGGDVHTRARVADPEGFLEKRVTDDLLAPKARDGNGRGMSILKGLGRGLLHGRIVGAAAEGVASGFDPSRDERGAQNDALGMDRARLAVLREQMDARAGTRLRDAQASLAEAKPDMERERASALALYRRQQAVQREITNRLKDPRPFDAAKDADLLSRAASVGVNVPTGMFGDYKNRPTMEVLDPSDPSGTTKTRLEYDRASGDWMPVAAGGSGVTTNYAQPLDPKTGMTNYQTGSLQLGGANYKERVRHNLVGESQGSERIGIARGHLTLAQAAQDTRFSEQDRKRYDGANKLAAKAEEYDTIASAIERNREFDYKDPATGEMVHVDSKRRAIERDKNLAAAAEARRELFTSYRDAFNTDEQAHVLMTEAEFKALFPTLAAKRREGEYLGEALRLGIQLTDGPGAKPDATNYTPSPIQRRSRRGAVSAAPAPSAGKTHVTRADARRLYPQLKDASDADVDAAIRAGGYEPIP
jgi:hypothetical protein